MKYITLVFLFFFCIDAFSQEQKGILRPENGKVANIQEGDSFVAEFTFWPISHVGNDEFKKNYLGKAFLDSFHVVEVFNEGFSPNNAEAYEVRMKLVLIKFFDSRNFKIWAFRGLNIPVTIKSVNPSPLEGRSKDFIFIEQDYRWKEASRYTIPLLLLFAVLAVVITFLPGYWRKKKVQRKLREELREWNKRFQMADNRSEYERIYKLRQKWEVLLPSKTPEILDFYSSLNDCQFKKEWSEEDQRLVKESFETIRNIFV